jgi:hypothetical protein
MKFPEDQRSFCMPPYDGHMTETCCSNDIGGGEEELLR